MKRRPSPHTQSVSLWRSSPLQTTDHSYSWNIHIQILARLSLRILCDAGIVSQACILFTYYSRHDLKLKFLHPCVNIFCSFLGNQSSFQVEVCNWHPVKIRITIILLFFAHWLLRKPRQSQPVLLHPSCKYFDRDWSQNYDVNHVMVYEYTKKSKRRRHQRSSLSIWRTLHATIAGDYLQAPVAGVRRGSEWPALHDTGTNE